MKIKVSKKSYNELASIESYKHINPKKPIGLLWMLARVLSKKTLKDVNFKYELVNMEKLDKNEPCIILMNHSSDIDFKILERLLRHRKFHIVATDDAFIGQEKLIRGLGCIPTKKFITDPLLIKDMKYVVSNLKESVVIFPEASYSFDGTATNLPDNFAKFLKLLNVPVIMIKTKGAFLREPLYNNLQVRKVNVSATMKYLLSKEDFVNKTIEELQDVIKSEFSFDYFKEQYDDKIAVNEPFRADYLNRVIYKCPNCKKEGFMIGKGITLSCKSCNKEYELDEYGKLSGLHIPDLYKQERESVKEEIINNTYHIECDCTIYVLKDLKSMYDIGTGHLIVNKDGFYLKSDDNKLEYKQSPMFSYSIYSDYNWYEVGDVIVIGGNKERYYCFPTNAKDIVAKVRLATEELYKLNKEENKLWKK